MDVFDKKFEQILIHRKPEFWLNDIFSNLTEYYNNVYPEYIFYKNVNDLLFEYDSKNKCFYYDYSKIYLILRDKYHCNILICDELIKGIVEKHLKLSIKTTLRQRFHERSEVEEHLNLCKNNG